jgi:predicted  nucleic acid-binding Zn-ribbon protein
MHPDLERLVALQQSENDLRRLEAELGAVPQARAELEARLAAERARLEQTRVDMETCQRARRQHEAALQDLEARRSKYKGQLMEVKTNKEYTAMLHEIEAVERDVRASEDQILAEMERAEALATEVRREEAALAQVEQEVRQERQALEARAGALGQRAERLGAERDGIAATISEDALALFRRVARLRGGVGVAEARDGMCQLCHVKLRPQMYVELKRNERIIQCESCSRILHYVPPPPTVAPQP